MANSRTDDLTERKRGPQKRSQITRQRILDAARDVILTKGYEQSTTQEIAQAAGVAEGSVFSHFGSKQGLLTGLMVEHYDGLIKRVTEISESQPDPQIRMMCLIEYHVARLLDGWNAVRMFAQYGRFTDSPVSQEFYRLNKEYSRVFVSCIDDLKSSGVLSSDTSSSLYRDMLFGTMEHWSSRTLELGQPMNRAGFMQFIAAQLGIGSQENSARLDEISAALQRLAIQIEKITPQD